MGKLQMCTGLEYQSKEFKLDPHMNCIFRLFLQGKHRTDLTREEPEQLGDTAVVQ